MIISFEVTIIISIEYLELNKIWSNSDNTKGNYNRILM